MKKLFFANLVPVKKSAGFSYKPDGEHEIDIGNDWDGDIESYIKKEHLKITTDKYFEENCTIFHKEYPLKTPLDRKGIKAENELFCEFDDGDLWSMTLYYTREE